MRSLSIATVAVLGSSAVAVAATTTQSVTRAGVGAVTLGAAYQPLFAEQKLGPLQSGCELDGTHAKSARLVAPLSGSVDLTSTSPRKVSDIVIRGGASASGVGIGATIAQITAKFPRAKVDHSTDAMFAVTLVTIPRGEGGPFQFAVSTKTHATQLIGIPDIPFCE